MEANIDVYIGGSNSENNYDTLTDEKYDEAGNNKKLTILKEN